MKITIKTLQQKQFQIDADGSETVADLKAKILQSQGHPVENQKLIYSGKVLTDSKSVESCEIKEKDFLVLMVSKPKVAPASSVPSTSVEAPPPPAPTSPPPAPVPAPAPPIQSATPVVSTTPASAAPQLEQRVFGDTSSFLTGDQLQSSINSLMEMGFPRDQVMAAMKASYNNPDRAVEYLMNGIPAHLQQTAAPAPPAGSQASPPPAQAPSQPTAASQPAPAPAPPAVAAPPAPVPVPATQTPQNLFQLAQQQAQGRGPAGIAGAGGAGPALNIDPRNPQLAQLRELVQQNPALLQPLIQQMAQNNPQLAQMLNQNPEALMQLLGGEDDDELGGLGGEGGPHVINITPEENAAIQRLEALGFPRQQAIEAYLACDKNEELAANYLFESGFDDDAN